jgi:succinyl-CoA synthetase beta subunit
MARLHEYQGKALLAREGIAIPRGRAAASADEAAAVAREVAGPSGRVVIKVQAWTTNRKAIGGVAFADSPEQAAEHARRMLAMKVGNFPVTHVLVEEALPIRDELFVSLFIDERERAPAILVSLAGGSGIEERTARGDAAVRRFPCDVAAGPDERALRDFLAGSTLARELHQPLLHAIRAVFAVARKNEARSVEINPLVATADGRIVAADCRIAIDDYAVFRHPDLGIDIARELDHPPTPLERIAYAVEQADHRGTFFFAQMNTAPVPVPLGAGGGSATPGEVHPPDSHASRRLIGFHGAGGGGSMMAMDAITAEGFSLANFCDTSGNPSPAKVYRAARIILAQSGLVGYFGSGSGVANQEQFWSAYGLAKAFWELNLDIPAVIRLGGNTEDRAVDILESACRGLPGRVEGYRKTDPPARIAARFAALVAEAASHPRTAERAPAAPAGAPCWQPRPPRRPPFVGSPAAISFPVRGGTVWIDPAAWRSNAAAIIARSSGLLRDDHGRPALAVSPEEFAARDSEMIACEVECRRDGIDGVFVVLDIPGLDALVTGEAR